MTDSTGVKLPLATALPSLLGHFLNPSVIRRSYNEEDSHTGCTVYFVFTSGNMVDLANIFDLFTQKTLRKLPRKESE